MATQPSPWQRLRDNIVLSAMHSPLGGEGIARAYYKLKGHSDEEINRAIDAESRDIEARYKDAPAIQHVRKGHPLDYVSPENIGRGTVDLLGTLIGGADPTFAVAPGRSVAQRVLGQAAVQGGASVARQGVEINTKQRQKFDPTEVIKDAAIGAVFQGGMEGVGKLAKVRAPKFNPTEHLAPDGLPGNGSVRPMDPQEISRIMNDPMAAGGANDNLAPTNRRQNNRDLNVSNPTEEDLAALPPANREFIEQPPKEFDPTEHLTPAEAQEMDASAPKPVVDNTGYEAHTPYIDEPAAPANDLHDADIVPIDPTNVPEGPLTSEGRVHKGFEEHPTDDPDGNKFLTYTASNGDKLPIKMGIDPDGTAEIAIDQFSTKANRLGPREIRSAMGDLMDMYPEIKRFGGYRRSGAGKGRVQEIEPTRSLKDLVTNEEGAFTPFGKGKKPKVKDIPDDDLTPEQRVIKAMDAAAPVRESQEQAYRIERAKRFEAAKKTQYVNNGEAGFHQELSNLSGEMEQLPSPYSARPKLNQADVDNLYNQVRDHPALSYTDTLHARSGLQKLLANSEASVPTRSELEVLRKVFSEDPTKRKKSISSWVADIINAPRSIMASTDLSAPLRQGLPLIHRKEYWTSFVSMFKQLGPKAFDEVKNEIASRPSYHLMRDSGLALTDVDADLSHHEERFMSSLANKIPVFGHIVKASERAYVGFLNKLRADTFDSIVNNARATGQKLTPKDIKGIAEFINTATGRGDLNGLVPKFLRGEEFDANKASPLLSGMLFSPRLMASRMQMLNPVYYVKLPPIARKEALKSLFAMTAVVTTTLGLAKAAGLSVETNPTSTDFAKIKVGNTRYDITGGFQAYIRLAAQLAMGAKKGPDGEETSLTSGKFGQPTRLDAIGSFLKNKESPAAAFAHDMLIQQDRDFNKIDKDHPKEIARDVGKDFIPLVIQDMYDVFNDQGGGAKGAKATAISLPAAVFGIGVQTYSPKKKDEKLAPAGFDSFMDDTGDDVTDDFKDDV